MSTITRAQAETVLIKRTGRRMTFVEMDGTTTDGTNADLDDALAVALRNMSKTASNPVTNADLATLEDSEIDQFYDIAEFRVLESVYGNLDMVDIAVGPRRESLSQFGEQLEKALTRLGKKLESQYGVGASSISAGVIVLGFAQQESETDE